MELTPHPLSMTQPPLKKSIINDILFQKSRELTSGPPSTSPMYINVCMGPLDPNAARIWLLLMRLFNSWSIFL